MSLVALVTGVAGGIGTATAELFRSEGWAVIGVDRRSPEKSLTIDRFISADVSSVSGCERLFQEVRNETKTLNALVNNAAILLRKPLAETSSDEWDESMSNNLRSAYLALQNALPLMSSNGGAIVNVSSVHAIATSSGMAMYAASKGALVALTRSLSIELAPLGIRVNAVLPGATETPMLKHGLEARVGPGSSVEELMRDLLDKHPMGRIGRPEEVAQAILFLCDSGRSSFITGQSLVVDGGATARLSTE